MADRPAAVRLVQSLGLTRLGRSFCGERSSTESTTLHAEEVTAPVRIIHPFHPRFGQEIALVIRRHHWGEDRVFYRDAHGHMASLPACWTSVVPEDPFVTVAAGRARFRVDDLIELAAVVVRLRS